LGRNNGASSLTQNTSIDPERKKNMRPRKNIFACEARR
jgi:hypothetical protein